MNDGSLAERKKPGTGDARPDFGELVIDTEDVVREGGTSGGRGCVPVLGVARSRKAVTSVAVGEPRPEEDVEDSRRRNSTHIWEKDCHLQGYVH